jgi:hypothetical protein
MEAEAGKPEPLIQIVGLVKNTKYYELREDFWPIGFLSIAQDDDSGPRHIDREGTPSTAQSAPADRAAGIRCVVFLRLDRARKRSVSFGHWEAIQVDKVVTISDSSWLDQFAGRRSGIVNPMLSPMSTPWIPIDHTRSHCAQCGRRLRRENRHEILIEKLDGIHKISFMCEGCHRATNPAERRIICQRPTKGVRREPEGLWPELAGKLWQGR